MRNNLSRSFNKCFFALPFAFAMATSVHAAITCPTSPQSKLNNLFGPTSTVTVIAHRGLWGPHYDPRYQNLVPENSLASIDAASNACLDAMELDVKTTSDGTPVLMHDYNLGRTTNIWQKIGGQKYNPGNTKVGIQPSGTNPRVDSQSIDTVRNLNVLIPDRSMNSGGNYVPSVEQAIFHWRNYGNPVPIIFDVKTADAARKINALGIKYLSRPGDVMAMKVNVSTYPSRAAYTADVPYIKGIPVFVTNNLGNIDIPKAYNNWVAGRTDAVEVNVKAVNGILQVELNRLKLTRNGSGVFNALPDFEQRYFYDSDGHCCYALSDKFYTDPYSGVKESSDLRGDWNYLNNQGFTFITTDDPIGLGNFLHSKGRH